MQGISGDEQDGLNNHSPKVAIVEILDSRGRRCNYEQCRIYDGFSLEFSNGNGDLIRISFFENRQRDKNYPLDKEAAKEYLETIK